MYLHIYLISKSWKFPTYIYICADVNETTSLLAGLAGQESLAIMIICGKILQLNNIFNPPKQSLITFI